MADVEIETIILQGTFAARPAAADALEYYATDTDARYWSDGATWFAQPAAVETHAASHASAGSDAVLPAAASQAEMEAGTEAALRAMTPLRVAQAIAALASGSGVAQGTSFPGGPSTNDHFCRTDLNNMEFFFDGTRWRSVQVFVLPMGVWNSAHTSFAATVNGVFRTTCPPSSGGSDWYILEHTIAFFISGGTALSASHKWVGTFVKTDAANANTTVATQTIDSGSLDIHRRQAVAVDALLGTTFPLLQSNWTKTGTPGTFFIQEAFSYQIVAV